MYFFPYLFYLGVEPKAVIWQPVMLNIYVYIFYFSCKLFKINKLSKYYNVILLHTYLFK